MRTTWPARSSSGTRRRSRRPRSGSGSSRRSAPGNTISLTQNGRRVTTLTAGPYSIVVRDRSRTRNFHLIGPGVNRKTGVARMGTFTWNLTLRVGAHRFVSDPQARRLRGTFHVH